ncbi:MAG: MFS transporter, partial [Gemmatimonadota bacterium]
MQFSLLVLVNVFVGGMVGLERVAVPLLAEEEFGLASRTVALSFIASFGLVKAFANYFAGRASERLGRKRVLVAGWVAALPVPFLVIWAPAWEWIVAANVLLGLNQGLAWSTTVIMKIDLVGPRRRGLAMGLNEAAGYLAVAGAAFWSGEIAARYGLRPEPFYLGIVLAALGLAFSLLAVRETRGHALLEAGEDPRVDTGRPGSHAPAGRRIFATTSWRDPALASCSQAGLMNNLNDGMAWGLFPLLFAAGRLSVEQIGVLVAVYPATWGLAQLGTGALSDRWGRKPLIAGGMALQGVALLALAGTAGYAPWLVASIGLGLGTAMAYPTLLAAIGDRADPSWRASAVGVYRLWRDLGYVAGAGLAGALADRFGIPFAIGVIGAL